MVLGGAFSALAQRGQLPIRSNHSLQVKIDRHPKSVAGRLFADQPLEPSLVARPIDVLLELSRVSAPRGLPEPLLSIHRGWTVLKYFGMFDLASPELRLSPAAATVMGNARRMFSEELGIGFACRVARHYLDLRVPHPYTLRIQDVDSVEPGSAMDGYFAFVSARRPDYYLIVNRPDQIGRFQVHTLEAKGSISASTSLSQLAKATHQLWSLRLNGEVPPGLACSTLLADREVASSALVVDPTEELSPWSGVVEVTIEPEEIDIVPPEGPQDLMSQDRDASRVVSTSLRSSWLSLSRRAADEQADAFWRSRIDEALLAYPAPPTRQVRAEIAGALALGSTASAQTPDGTVSVFTGVLESVVDALRSGRSRDVLTAQAESTYFSRLGGEDDDFTSVGDDGAVLKVSVR
jgi:hypothetical protein